MTLPSLSPNTQVVHNPLSKPLVRMLLPNLKNSTTPQLHVKCYAIWSRGSWIPTKVISNAFSNSLPLIKLPKTSVLSSQLVSQHVQWSTMHSSKFRGFVMRWSSRNEEQNGARDNNHNNNLTHAPCPYPTIITLTQEIGALSPFWAYAVGWWWRFLKQMLFVRMRMCLWLNSIDSLFLLKPQLYTQHPLKIPSNWLISWIQEWFGLCLSPTNNSNQPHKPTPTNPITTTTKFNFSPHAS